MRTVFLSSTSGDLFALREALYAAIETLEGYHCVRMEDFTSQAHSPLSYLTDLLPTCHLAIFLVGPRYGSSPPDKDYSFTELEYDTARGSNLPCLAFCTPDTFPVPNNLREEDGIWEKQQRFRKKVRRDLICATFGTADQLATQVVAAIRNWERGGRLPPSRISSVDCVILCGGYARRLWPLTIDIAKVTLPVGNRPLLAHLIDFVRKSHFISSISLSVSQLYADQIRSFCSLSTIECPVHMVVEPGTDVENKLGPIGALDFVISKREQSDLLVIGGDNLFGFELEDFQRFAASQPGSSNAFFRVVLHEDTSEYGVGTFGPDFVLKEFQEKTPISNFKNVSTACYFFRCADLGRIQKYLAEGQDPDSLGSFIHWLIKRGHPPACFSFNSWWFDIGTREKLLAANRHYIVNYHRGSVVESELKGPVQLHETSTIKTSVIGPCVCLGPHVRVVDSQIRNSIVLDHTTIRHSHLSDSVVGPYSEIEGGGIVDLVCGPRSRISQKE